MSYTRGTFCVVPIKSLIGLHPYSQLLYVWLCHHANQDGICWPSLSVLAKECNISRRSVIRYLTVLINEGFLTKKTNNKEKEYCANNYQLEIQQTNRPNGSVSLSLPSDSEAPPLVPDSHPNYNNIEQYPSNYISNDYASKTRIDNIKSKQIKECEKEFEIIWANYPKRYGVNPKEGASRCYIARRKEKELYATIFKGVVNYRDWCKENNKTNTEYVLKASTFLGKDKHYLSFQTPMKKRHWSEGVTVDM